MKLVAEIEDSGGGSVKAKSFEQLAERLVRYPLCYWESDESTKGIDFYVFQKSKIQYTGKRILHFDTRIIEVYFEELKTGIKITYEYPMPIG